MRPKRLISLLVAVCMMITMLPLSAVTAFAADTSTVHEANDGDGIYKYAYTVNAENGTATITKFLGPVKPTRYDYDIDIPETLDDKYTVTAIGNYAFYSDHQLGEVTIPQSVTSIGDHAFELCKYMTSVTINDAATSIGKAAFEQCEELETLKLGEHITTIGETAFFDCRKLDNVTIPDSVASIGRGAFGRCWQLKTLKLGENIETIGDDSTSGIFDGVFYYCYQLSKITIPEKVKTINPKTFEGCSGLKSITLPAGLTTFPASLEDCLEICPADCVIYYNNDETHAHDLFGDKLVGDKLAGHKFLCLCNVTFDANGGSLTDKGGNPTNHAVVSAYKTKRINADDLAAIPNPTRAGYNFTGWYTKGGTSLNVNDIITKDMTEDITFYAHWEFDPDAPSCHPLTVTGGIVTVKKGDKDVTDTLTVTTDATTGQKTYYVPQGAEVTVKLDKNTVHNGKVFNGWSTTGNLSLLTGQDSKAETITFTMNSDAKVSAKYRDAATDHTHDTAVCHPLTVTGGIVTVKNGDKDVTDTLTVTTDETTGKKTYSVPDGATVTVTLDKTLIPEGMVFDIWSTGKFSLPLGQDYKAESITFTMNTMSSDADIAAQYRDATIEDDGPNVLGTAAIIGTAAVGTAVLGYQAYSLGAEFAGKLMALPYFPSNRSALAMMLWEDAGKPMPESELLYPDVEQEEQDMDLQHAARWAMENELIPDLNDEGTAPEEMKFFPANPVSKLDVLNAWQKAQELKNN
ncbi:MAG: leucine-rich repeat protein [Faecalibacterium sp.]